jgi:hypothetical protein
MRRPASGRARTRLPSIRRTKRALETRADVVAYFTGGRKRNGTIEAWGLETADGFAAERTEPFFDEATSETSTDRLRDLRPTNLSPPECHFCVGHTPRHQDTALGSRKRPIFRSVGCA